jgi:hypothetical protein
MNPKAPGIWKAATIALSDVYDVLHALTLLSLVAFLIVLAFGLVPFFIPVAGWTRLSVIAMFAGLAAAQAFLLTPYLIAVHRFIILSEVTRNYRIVPVCQRLQRFFGWLLVFMAIIWVTALLSNRLVSFRMSSLPSVILTIAAVAAIVVLAIVMLRLIILFPAIAVDAFGITWSPAMADSKDNIGRAFLIFALAFLALAVAGGAATGLVVFLIGALMRGAAATLTLASVLAILFAIVRTIGVTLAAAIASRLYQWCGNASDR